MERSPGKDSVPRNVNHPKIIKECFVKLEDVILNQLKPTKDRRSPYRTPIESQNNRRSNKRTNELSPSGYLERLNLRPNIDTEDNPPKTPKPCYVSLERLTPKASNEFNRELKEVINARNLLTSRTKKKVLDALDKIDEDSKFQKRTRKKENAIREILTSETSYVKQLKTIIDFFMKPVQKNRFLNEADFETIFGNIETIYNINEKLLQELESDSLNVANAFISIAPYFKLYSSYALQFKHSIDLIHKSRLRNPHFYKFVEQQETRPEVQKKLSALLIAPIQRIPRYKLLLVQLIEAGSRTDSDYKLLQDSLSKVEEVANHVNKMIEEQENIQKLLEVQRCLRNQEPCIITPGRFLIKEGILWKFNGKQGANNKYYTVLLNDIILLCKMKKETLEVNSLKCKEILPVNKCKVTEALDKGCFKIDCKEEEYVFFDKQLSETKCWIYEISEAILETVENRKTLRKESSSRRPVKRKDLNEYSDIGLSPGLPLVKKRKFISEEIKSSPPRNGRATRSMTPTRSKRNASDRLQASTPLLSTKFAKDDLSLSNIRLQNQLPGTSNQVFVFGQDQGNHSFTFRFTNILSNIGSSVKNFFGFKRNK